MIDATNGNIQKVNSLITDTCTAMNALWNTISQNFETSYIFTTLYNSHGINLFIQDIFTLLWYKTVLTQIQAICQSFQAVHKEYAVLGDLQQIKYGHKQALIFYCWMDWGTQVAILKSLLKSQLAFIQYA